MNYTNKFKYINKFEKKYQDVIKSITIDYDEKRKILTFDIISSITINSYINYNPNWEFDLQYSRSSCGIKNFDGLIPSNFKKILYKNDINPLFFLLDFFKHLQKDTISLGRTFVIGEKLNQIIFSNNTRDKQDIWNDIKSIKHVMFSNKNPNSRLKIETIITSMHYMNKRHKELRNEQKKQNTKESTATSN